MYIRATNSDGVIRWDYWQFYVRSFVVDTCRASEIQYTPVSANPETTVFDDEPVEFSFDVTNSGYETIAAMLAQGYTFEYEDCGDFTFT